MTLTWVLLVLVHVGPLGDGNSNSLFAVPGFLTEAECDAAGRKAKKMVRGSVKDLEFVCLEQTRQK